MRLATRLALVIGLAWPLAARGDSRPREVAAVTLPSREPTAALLATRMRALGASLARARGASLIDGPLTATSAADVAGTLARAQELAAAGDLDEAARLLDPALDAGTRAPHRFADSDALVAAVLTRVSIALARGETEVAARWLERLLRWAPTLALTSQESTPRLVAALAQARRRLGPEPELVAADLGGLCAVDELLVARVLAAGRVEVQRLRHCHVEARVTVTVVDDSLLPLLGVEPRRESVRSEPPVWRRGWFWVGVGVTASIAAAVLWTATEPEPEVDVVPRF